MAGDVSKRKEKKTYKFDKIQMTMMATMMKEMDKKFEFKKASFATDNVFGIDFQVQKDAKIKRRSQDVSSVTRRPERNPQPYQFSSSTKSLLGKRQHLPSKQKLGFNKSDLLQERSRPGRLLETPIRTSRGQSKLSKEEEKLVHTRDDQDLRLRVLKQMSTPQNITDMCNQIFKELEKDKRQSTRPSPKVPDPMGCSKQEQIIQEMGTEKVRKESETGLGCFLFSPQSELVISNTCDELTCFEPVQPISLDSVSQVLEENSAGEEQKSSPSEEVLEQPNNTEAEAEDKSFSVESQEHCKELVIVMKY